MTAARTWVNPVLWVLALVIINALWSNVSRQEAPNEVNSIDRFETHRSVTVAAVFGSSNAIPATFETDFTSLSLEQANVSFSIKKNNVSVIHSWSGLLTETPPKWEGRLEPGNYTVVTEVEEGVDVEQVLMLEPFDAIRFQGHVVLSLLLVVLAFVEQGIRAFVATRTPTSKTVPEEKAPFKRRSHAREDDLLLSDEEASPWRAPLTPSEEIGK
jgi:hypothetical protein